MKRILSLLIVLCMLSVSFGVFAPAGATTYGYLLGDADDDGSLTMKDVIVIRKFILGLTAEKQISLLAADADKNKSNDMKDVIVIRNMLLGIVDEEGNNVDSEYKIDTITIADKNISRYTLVLSRDYDECMMYSAKQLRNYIDDACGIYLNVTDNEENVEGYKIKYEFDSGNRYELGKEGYRVAVDSDDNLIVTCGSMRGPLYATYYILEEIVGYRFLVSDFSRISPAAGFKNSGSVTYLYEAENVNIPEGFEETDVPYLSYRALSQGGVVEENFAPLRLNAVDGSYGGITNARYGWGVGTLFIHAHSYELQCGISPKEQPCLTSEDTYNKIVEYNLNLLATRASWGQYLNQHYTQISCSPNDNTNFCKCSRCSAVYREEGSLAGTVFRLANRVAEKMEEAYPGIEVFTIAYWDARNPPKMTRPHENICVCFCFGGCNNHPYDDVQACVEAGGNPRPMEKAWDGTLRIHNNYDEMDYYDKWTELTNNIYAWYYSANFTYYMAPSPNVFNVYNDLKYIASMGAEGIYFEGSSRPYYSFEWLRGYLGTKMMWNPFMSEEEFNGYLDEYLMICYGAGWRYIREYLSMANEAGDLNGCWTNNFDRPFNMYNKDYLIENYDTMTGLFEKAYEAAETDEERFRISVCRLHCDWLGLSATFERDYENGDEASRALYTERYIRMYNTIVKYDIVITSIGGDGFDDRGCQNFPKDTNTVINPMNWIFAEDFSGYWEYRNGRWV